MDDHVLVKGHVRITKNGKVVHEGRNLVVNVGLSLIASLLCGSGSIPSHMAVGDNGNDPAGPQTDLVGTEIARVTSSGVAANNTVSYHADFTGENSGTESVREFGIFNASTSGVMLCRFICPEITWEATDTLMVDWTIDIGEMA